MALQGSREKQAEDKKPAGTNFRPAFAALTADHQQVI